MKFLRFLKGAAVSFACWGMLMPQSRMQAAGPSQASAAAPVTRAVAAERTTVSNRVPGRQPGNDRTSPQPRIDRQPVIRAQSPQVIDVALGEGGTLIGLVMDTEGYAIADIEVVAYQDGRELVRTMTNENGNFAVANLTGGVYQFVAGDGQGVFRLWAPGTAPPGAQQQAVIVISGTYGPEIVEVAEERAGILGLDVITLALLAAAITAIVLASQDGGGDTFNEPASP